MAILTGNQLDEIATSACRMAKAKKMAIDYNRPIIDAAIQAIEDWFEANKASGSQAIDDATSSLGYTFNVQQKKFLFMYWFLQKFRREEATI